MLLHQYIKERCSMLRIALVAGAILGFPLVAAALDVTVTKLRNTKGDVVVCVWRATDEGFPKCADGRPFKKAIAPASNPQVSFSDLPAGQYAVSMFHDEKRAGRPERNLFGIPTSGVGIANNPKLSVTNSPTFEKGRINVPGATLIEIEAQYLF